MGVAIAKTTNKDMTFLSMILILNYFKLKTLSLVENKVEAMVSTTTIDDLLRYTPLIPQRIPQPILSVIDSIVHCKVVLGCEVYVIAQESLSVDKCHRSALPAELQPQLNLKYTLFAGVGYSFHPNFDSTHAWL
tara:strand:- start:170 stop:571 length:402 start_codon:yes stop_codon:yes gene_type:complete